MIEIGVMLGGAARRSRTTASWVTPLILTTASFLGCEDKPKVDPPAVATPTVVQSKSKEPDPTTLEDAGSEDEGTIQPSNTARKPEAKTKKGRSAPNASDDHPWQLDPLVDIGPAAPATATARGVVMIDRANRLWWSKLKAKPGQPPEPAELPEGAGPFPLARGPAVHATTAYWIARGELWRQTEIFSPRAAQAEALAKDARSGTRVAAPTEAPGELAPFPEAVAYLALGPQQKSELVARLWMKDKPTLTLTPEGTAASSVALVRTARGLTAFSIDGRTGMTPVHAREVTLDGAGKPELGPDEVVWVGGATGTFTELFAAPNPKGTIWGFIPMEQDITHFGLAQIALGPSNRKGDVPKPRWFTYRNGLDPSPVTGAHLCDELVVVRAEPETGKPKAPQVLRLSSVDEAKHSEVVAHSAAFFDVSIAEISKGALLVYVADRRTFARTIRCKKP